MFCLVPIQKSFVSNLNLKLKIFQLTVTFCPNQLQKTLKLINFLNNFLFCFIQLIFITIKHFSIFIIAKFECLYIPLLFHLNEDHSIKI